MSKLINAIRTGSVSTRLGRAANAQVTRDGVRVDSPVGTIDTRDTPIHRFMKSMNDSQGFMRPTQYKVDFNLEEDFFRENKIRRPRNQLGDSSPLGALTRGLQGTADQISNAVGEVFGSGSLDKFEVFSLNCHNAILPSDTFSMSDTQKIDGHIRRNPVARAYATEATFTFYVSKDAFERALMLEWHEKIIQHSRHRVNYHRNYVTDISVKTLMNDSASTSINLTGSVDESVGHEVILENAFPVTINEIELSYSDISQIVSMSVMFYFDRAIWARQQDQEQQEFENDILRTERLTNTNLF